MAHIRVQDLLAQPSACLSLVCFFCLGDLLVERYTVCAISSIPLPVPVLKTSVLYFIMKSLSRLVVFLSFRKCVKNKLTSVMLQFW